MRQANGMLGFPKAYLKIVGSAQCFSPTRYLTAVPGRCLWVSWASNLSDSHRSTMEPDESRCCCAVKERLCWHEFEVNA